MPKLLALSCCFPPVLLPQSIQIHRTIHAVSQADWQATVVCAEPDTIYGNQDPMLEGLYTPSYTCIRVSAAPLLHPWYMRLCHHIPFVGRSPDRYLPWALRSARTIVRKLNRNDFDTVCTFGNPMSVHIAGAVLKQVWGVPWIAHFSDPWIDNPYSEYGALDRWINRKQESITIEKCDAVVFTTNETRDLVMKKYPDGFRKKAFVIPHAFDENLYPNTDAPHEKLTFRSVGNFYGPRSPRVLLDAVALLHRESPELIRRCRFEFVGIPPDGAENLLEEYTIGSCVNFYGQVNYLKSLALMKEADVLLLIDAPADVSVFLPSKLIDYLGADRPILGLTPNCGASANLIHAVDGTVVPPNDPHEIANAIQTLFERWVNGNLQTSVDRSVRHQFTSEETTRQWNEILCTVSTHPHQS